MRSFSSFLRRHPAPPASNCAFSLPVRISHTGAREAAVLSDREAEAASLPKSSGSRPEEAGQPGGLLYPVRHLRLVELVALADVDVARVLALAGARRERSQRRAAEERHLDVVRE